MTPHKESRTPFEQLVENALDFAAASIRQLDKDPKYSVINFYTAVELFLKARLVDEHWSLAVSNLQKATKQGFDQADFQSIGLEEATLRIKNTLPAGESLTEGEFKAYDLLRKRRNKSVHFYHPDYLGGHQPEVAVEQFLAWRYLYRRLRTTWSESFKGAEDRIEELNQGIIGYEKYFDAVFQEFRKRLEETKGKKKSDKPISPIGFCVSCERQAVEIRGRRHTKHVFSGVCQVCDEEQILITLPCKECSNEVAVSPWKEIPCLNCNCISSYNPNSLEADLGVPPLEESWGYCHLCDAGPSPSVMPLGLDSGEHALLCVSCFQFQKTGSLNVCGWCRAMVTGDVGTDRDPGCVWCAHDFEVEAGEVPSCSYELPSLADWKKRIEFEDIWRGF